MMADKLKLNDDKTELMVIGTRAQMDKAVRLVCLLPRNEDVTSSFIRLQWLPIKFRINFKIAMLCFYKCIQWTCPQLSKRHGRHQEDSDIQPPLEHQYPVGRPLTTIEKKCLAIKPFPMNPPRFGTVSHNHITVTGKF